MGAEIVHDDDVPSYDKRAGSIKGDVKRKNLFRSDRRGGLGIEPWLGSAGCGCGRAGDCEDSRFGYCMVLFLFDPEATQAAMGWGGNQGSI
jgi:hypothetical protein